jgi:hypothetical protein
VAPAFLFFRPGFIILMQSKNLFKLITFNNFTNIFRKIMRLIKGLVSVEVNAILIIGDMRVIDLFIDDLFDFLRFPSIKNQFFRIQPSGVNRAL